MDPVLDLEREGRGSITMADIVSIGELLIDFTPYGMSEFDQPLYERNPGGAPANVLAALAKLGSSTEFIGKVGDDAFGRELAEILNGGGIGISGLARTEKARTTLAFVHLDHQGDRSFSFYRNPGADQLLEPYEVPLDMIARSKVFHFGSVSMSAEPSRSATLSAVRYAKEQGIVVSYDPNLRPALWNSADEAREWILEGMKYSDIVKVSKEELEFLTGTEDLDQGSRMLAERYGVSLLLVTLGGQGSYCRCGSVTAAVSGFPVKVVDTTGAGDGFMAGAIYTVLSKGLALSSCKQEEIEELLRFANAVGALATTRKGGIPAMPSLEEVLALKSSRNEPL